MKPVVKVLLALAALVLLVILYVTGSTIYWWKTKQSDREIATNVDISSQWTELSPQPPLKSTKQLQYLIICVDGYTRTLPDDTRLQIPLSDGTTANPEVVLVAEDGNAYPLRPSSLLSTGVGYSPAATGASDISFTKVRIRSDKPFRASNIYWENLNLK